MNGDPVRARLDERLARSPVRDGFVERQHFADAAAALWLEGEVVHLEDPVLHDADMDIRTPTHELTRACGASNPPSDFCARDPPVVLRAAALLEAWSYIDVLQHATWLEPLFVAALLRQEGFSANHLASLHIGAKNIPPERRRARNRSGLLL